MKDWKRAFSIVKIIVLLAACIVTTFLLLSGAEKPSPAADYPIRPVPFTQVRIGDVFWAPRLRTNQTVTIPYALRKNEETGRVENFRKAAGLVKGPFRGRRFNDSDVYKAMEAASYTLRLEKNEALEKELDDLVSLIAKAQEPDGYLFTTRTIDPKNPAPGSGPERWSNLRVSHELYNVGHMYEAAAAHFQATGKRSFLDIAVKNADLLVEIFGPGKRRAFPGHQEIEIGLAKLFRAAGNRAYLGLAKFFLDERGRYFQGERHDPKDPFAVYDSDEYMQNHKPVLEQDEAVGHAVRAMYMYAGMADVAALGGFPDYAKAIDRLWENVVGKKMYVTGGVGARSTSEAFGDAYELPNRTAYAETCAAVGHALWQQRLFLLHGEAAYVDVLERVMYNGLLSGVSLDGMSFFYQNPLESDGKTELYQGQVGRAPWFEVACCPPNISRFLPSVPGYVYALRDDAIYVNLFIANASSFDVAGRKIAIRQETRYPWDGAVRIAVEPEKPAELTVLARIPGWARNEPVPTDLYRFGDKFEGKPTLKVNGAPLAIDLVEGYARIRRVWAIGDILDLELPMPVRRVVAHPAVKADEGRVALQRGPVVYCAEGADNGGRVLDLAIPDEAGFTAKFDPALLDGVVVLSGSAGWGRPVRLIPYCAWANRGPGEMAVWFPRRRAD